MSEKASPKTVKEWLEEKRHEKQLLLEKSTWDKTHNIHSIKFIDELLTDPFLVEAEESAQKLQTEYDEYRLEVAKFNQLVALEKQKLQTDLEGTQDLAHTLQEERNKLKVKLNEANKLITIYWQEEHWTEYNEAIFIERLRGIIK